MTCNSRSADLDEVKDILTSTQEWTSNLLDQLEWTEDHVLQVRGGGGDKK